MKRSKLFAWFTTMIIPALTLLVPVTGVAATTNEWTGNEDGDWFNPLNWTEAAVPTGGSHVLLAATANPVLLTNSTAELASLVITNHTLTVSNWTTIIQATTVAVKANGRITMPGAFTESAGLSNRIHIVCADFTLDAQADILADARGYARGQGPGKGGNANGGGGAGFGGVGALGMGGLGGIIYGSTTAPTDPGSGGGVFDSAASHGGGAIRIDASGLVMINGTLSANGGNGGSYNGGGSGGSIYISCDLWGGTGILRANGGEGRDIRGGAGGGGRIAVDYQALSGDPSITYSVRHGVATYSSPRHPHDRYAPVGSGFAQMGTLWFSDTQVLDRLVTLGGGTLSSINGYMVFGSTNIWQPDQLITLNNANLGILPGDGFRTANHLTINGGSMLAEADAAMLDFGGDLTLTNGANLIVFAGMTNSGAGTDYGALVTIDGEFRIAPASWYIPLSHPTNGGSVHMIAGNVTIQEAGGIDANAYGFRSYQFTVYGPGAGISSGSRGGGGGYGGPGGRGAAAGSHGGGIYGETNRPLHAGSAGAFGHSPQPGYGHGGGYVRIDTGPMILDGTIMANGRNGRTTYGGGGSGGGIFIMCDSLEGSASGLISAAGGQGGNISGGGGGGRVAVAIGMTPEDRAKLIAGDEVDDLFVYSSHGPFLGTISATNGISPNAYEPLPEPGTAVFMAVSEGTYTLVVEGNPGTYGTPQPLNYGTTIGISADSILTNSVVTPADEANGLRRACIGWRLTDEIETLIDEDVTAQAVFTLSANRILTWFWTNQFQLNLPAHPKGSVSDVGGWYTNGTEVTLTATPAVDYEFYTWTGDVPQAKAFDNPLTVTMDQARTIMAAFTSLSGETKQWNGVGVWENHDNWTPTGMPGAMDEVEIQTGSVITGFERDAASVTVRDGTTLIFTNWFNALRVSGVVRIESNATVTLPPRFYHDQQPSNRVQIICREFILDQTAVIDAHAKGYLVRTGPGKGGGGSSNGGSGGGHGGQGGPSSSAPGGGTYGSERIPVSPGSGGGGTHDWVGGHGGGAVLIAATERLAVFGTINANGQNGATYNPGGAGGSILLIGGGLATSASTALLARGGNRGSGYTSLGGGGGGRIAVWTHLHASARARVLAGDDPGGIALTSFTAFHGTVDVDGGSGYGDGGEEGTKWFITIPGTMFRIR